ncbi:hypothetical protein WJX84_012414 [Apatococcus fuscideae]|uniref:Uncharacterized protein n=1 Tax=Apatococcus fuscideae TaxID=2026836 RepID=A0AAW1T5Y2_9CHLO
MGKSKKKDGMAVDEDAWTVPAPAAEMDTSAGNAVISDRAASIATTDERSKQRVQRGRSSRNQKQRRAIKLDKALAVADKKVTKRSKKQSLLDKKLSSKTLWRNQKR